MSKKLFAFSFSLIAIDQIIKLIIENNLRNSNVVLLPDILTLQPVQNTNLSWIASILDYKTPVMLMVVLQIFASVIIVLIYRYLSYLWIKGNKYLWGMMLFFLSGTACAFIDVVFWKGSLDYLRLFDWFTFDLKDVYLNIGIAFLLFFYIKYYSEVYHKMSKFERKQTSILIWLKKGMP